MFWSNNSGSSSQIETLLLKQDVTLQEVMDSDNIINDCRSQNKQLIDYLVKPEVMQELVTLTTVEPSIELEERTRYKYPNIACELLTCDVPALNERLASDSTLLEKLYMFLEKEPPLNPLLASFFSKIMGVLISKKSEQNWLSYQVACLHVLEFIKARNEFLPLLLRHLGTSAIMDLTLKLLTQIEGTETRQNALNWLDSQNIIQQIVGLLDPKVEKERHYNAAQLLCDFIRIARDNQRNSTERINPDPLLYTLESTETMSLLLCHILSEEKCESSIVGGIQVLLAILDINQSGSPYMTSNCRTNDVDPELRQKISFNATEAIHKRLNDCHNLLIDPPKKPAIMTTAGSLDPPLGHSRLQVCRLLAALLETGSVQLLEQMMAAGAFPVLLDLFFQYSWNNFLHAQVERCLVAAFSLHLSTERTELADALCKHLLVDCKLINRILDSWKENDEQNESKRIRQGYMGHLTNIVNKLVELCSTTSMDQFLKDNLPEVAEQLEQFKENILANTNKVAASLLAGVRLWGGYPDSFSDDDEINNKISPQEMFSEYQMRQLTPQFSYSGFADETFNDKEDVLLDMIHNHTEAQLDLSDEGPTQCSDQEPFKRACSQRIDATGDAEDQSPGDDRDPHTFQTVIERLSGNGSGAGGDISISSSDSEDSDQEQEADAWSNAHAKPLSLSKDPWGDVSSNGPFSTEGWANFNASNAFEAICSNRSSSLEDAAAFQVNFDDTGAVPDARMKESEVSFQGDAIMNSVEPEKDGGANENWGNKGDEVKMEECGDVAVKETAAGSRGGAPEQPTGSAVQQPSTSESSATVMVNDSTMVNESCPPVEEAKQQEPQQQEEVAVVKAEAADTDTSTSMKQDTSQGNA